MAKERARNLYDTIEFWFRRKYNLPANDPRFLDSTIEEMLTDFWAHTYYDDPKALDTYEDDDFDIDSVADEIGYTPPPADDDDWEELT